MNKREKIIVALMVLAVLYFVFDFFLLSGSGPKKQAENREQQEQAIVAMAQNLQEQMAAGDFKLPSGLRASLAELHQGWRPENFAPPELLPAETDEPEQEEIDREERRRQVEADAAELVYSGFLEAAGRRLAVVNGEEYQVGEYIDDLRLESITARALNLSRDGIVVRVPVVELDGASGE
ncbi:MAG: hypothetical protein U5J62_08945 [Desulfurivibrio sp.]|nr:hypothetical protein [Desulfurivibrio sp.]